MLKMYSELANWWPLVSHPDDYAEEAAFFAQIFGAAGLPPSPTLLELGCGGGNNASYLKKMFAQVTLSDLSADMLAVSRGLNPECEHVQGDMRTLRLGRLFDAVFVHDAIGYMTTPEDLRQAIKTVSVHCKPGGTALFVPDWVRETFEPSTNHHGRDGDGRAIRYLEWAFDPDERDTAYTVEYVYVLREDGLPTRVEHEAHICGLFPRADWLRWLEEVGFTPEVVRDEYNRDLFVGRRKA
jgi:SAM-dependent methyltransferase